jgi:hypothetical protein
MHSTMGGNEETDYVRKRKDLEEKENKEKMVK